MTGNFRSLIATVNRREFLFTGGAGLAGAIVGYLPIAPIDYSYSLGDYMSAPVEWYGVAAILVSLASIGGFIVAAEGSPSSLSARVKQRFLRGFFISLVFGFLGGVLGGSLFGSILSAFGGVRFGWHREVVQGSLSTLPLLTLIFARMAEWSVQGALLGLGIGIATFVWTKPLKGLAGGLTGCGKTRRKTIAAKGMHYYDHESGPWINVVRGQKSFFRNLLIGGFIVGVTVDPLTRGVHSIIAAHLAGYMLQGLFLGLAIGLSYELTKTAWLTVEAGRLRGRQFRLEKAAAIIGRAEECDIGLFGDLAVLGRHAQIERGNSQFVISDLAQRGDLCVNSQPVARAALNDGDRISIGGYVLTFHARAKVAGAGFPTCPTALGKEAGLMSPPVAQDAWLVNSQGRRIAVPVGGSLRIGREPDNSLVLDDNVASRYHAVIEPAGQGFRIRDLGSSNGTFVNGRRVEDAGVFLVSCNANMFSIRAPVSSAE